MANLILDYDGTLHESIHIYAPLFEKLKIIWLPMGWHNQDNTPMKKFSFG